MFHFTINMFQFVNLKELLQSINSLNYSTDNQNKNIFYLIQLISLKNSTALNDKKIPFNTTKITLAIIINFIYYRHSVLNVCLSLIEPDASHSVFFYLSLRQPTFYVLPLRNDNDY